MGIKAPYPPPHPSPLRVPRVRFRTRPGQKALQFWVHLLRFGAVGLEFRVYGLRCIGHSASLQSRKEAVTSCHHFAAHVPLEENLVDRLLRSTSRTPASTHGMFVI